eukprot:TRINITY_DN116627_c0_g1_i1.p1 TRINITY_DN116627_c0_g1~~TRINITY_DN116627_c0_g1_i1.p1  ORF type:complete len:541 (+),score=116.16 TRINITY_DN116627_c0_g1_i1:163-1785(+)
MQTSPCRRNGFVGNFRSRFFAAAAALLAVLVGSSLRWSGAPLNPSTRGGHRATSKVKSRSKSKSLVKSVSGNAAAFTKTPPGIFSEAISSAVALFAALQQMLLVAIITAVAAATAVPIPTQVDPQSTFKPLNLKNSLSSSFRCAASRRPSKAQLPSSAAIAAAAMAAAAADDATPSGGTPSESTSASDSPTPVGVSGSPDEDVEPPSMHSQRVPQGSQLATALLNGQLEASFARVEPMHEACSTPGTLLFHAQHQLEGAWYALKMVVLTQLRSSDGISDRKELQEVRSLGRLSNSKHVMRYVTAWCEELHHLEGILGKDAVSRLLHGTEADPAYKKSKSTGDSTHMAVLIVQTELCHGTNLGNWLDSRSSYRGLQPQASSDELCFADELHFAEQLAKACRDIHRAGLVHGNITPKSLFVVKGATLKVGDFSQSHPAEASPLGQLNCPLNHNQAVKDQADDIQAVAKVCLQLLACLCRLETGGRSFDELIAALSERLPEHAQLLLSMMKAQPSERPTASDVYAELKRIRIERAAARCLPEQ